MFLNKNKNKNKAKQKKHNKQKQKKYFNKQKCLLLIMFLKRFYIKFKLNLKLIFFITFKNSSIFVE